MVGYQVFFQAVAAVGVARGTLVALGSAPVVTGLLSWAVTRRAPGWRLAYLLFGLALRRVPAARAATLSLAEPVTAALLAVLVLGESLPATGWVGISLVGAGLVLASWTGRSPRPPRAAPP